MNINAPLPRKISRRLLVKLAAAAGLSAALGDVLLTYPPWLDYAGQVRRTWDVPAQSAATVPARMRELIHAATLAPSGHNAQPWKFSVLGSTIRLLPNYSRRLPAVDPQDRELWISLGCALESLVIAAQRAGYAGEVTGPAPDADFVTVRLSPASGPLPRRPVPLYEAIFHRQNTRSLYDGRAVPPAVLRQIGSVSQSAGVSFQMITAADRKEGILEYIQAGNRSQYGDPAFMAELVSWIRFNQPEALRSLDGLYTRCSGNPEVPRWLGERIFTHAGAGAQNNTDSKDIRSASGLLVLAAARDDKRHWIETGRLYERLALTLTALGLKTAFLNQPVEVAALRSQLQGYLGLGRDQPQLLLRFGYADPMPRSLRRPVEQVLA